MPVRTLSATPVLSFAALLGAVLLVAIEPGVAAAAAQLGNQTPIESNQPGTYTFTTTSKAWSVVSLRSSAGTDFDLTVQGGGKSVASRSTVTDFVLVDSNPGEQPLGSFTAKVVRYSGPGSYSLRFKTNTPTLTTPPANPGPTGANVLTTTGKSPVTVVRLKLQPGKGFRLRYPPHTSVYVINDNPAQEGIYANTVLDRNLANGRNLLTMPGVASGIWSIGDWQSGGCAAYTDLGFAPTSTPALVLVDDDPLGSAGKTFYPFAYNRDTDPEGQCPTS